MPINTNTSDSSWSPETKVGHTSPRSTIRSPKKPDLGAGADLGNMDEERGSRAFQCPQRGGGGHWGKIPLWKVPTWNSMWIQPGDSSTEEEKPSQTAGEPSGYICTWTCGRQTSTGLGCARVSHANLLRVPTLHLQNENGNRTFLTGFRNNVCMFIFGSYAQEHSGKVLVEAGRGPPP